MKFVFFIFCSFLIFLSCKKDTGIQPAPIAGAWVWWKTPISSLPPSATNPMTPQNTGISELMYFTPDGNWKIKQNGNTIDSGIYSIGHGSYLPYVGAYHYIYDSIGFYRAGNFLGWDSYKINQDTLIINPFYSGRFSSYLLPYNGIKYFIKQ